MRKTVLPIRDIPAIPKANAMPGLGNEATELSVNIVRVIALKQGISDLF